MFIAAGMRRTWLQMLAIGPFVLLLAFIPSFLYVDHWAQYLGHEAQHASGEPEEPDAHVSHGQHCHYGPSSCAELPAPAGGRVLPAVVDVAAPELATVALTTRPLPLEAVFVAVPKEPPRGVKA